jgi:D-arginine dehydrogenase
VVVLEAEAQPGYHSTGRSAAFWAETYGGPLVQPLTTASGRFLADPPQDFHDRPFLSPRGAVTLGRSEDLGLLDAMESDFADAGVMLERLKRPALEARIPGLRPEWTAGVLEPNCEDIDVAALHGAYLRFARARGGKVMTDAAVKVMSRSDGRWDLSTAKGPISAAVVVNAAGAWADEVAALAGAATARVQPYRRTIAQLRTAPPAPDDLPLVIDARGCFYFKPEAGGRLWLSPLDETPCAACDASPEELDIALAIDRFEKVVDWAVERVEHRWAGLRSFTDDRLPIYGYDPFAPGFFWCAGQGGFGIQTAPAAAKLAASLLLKAEPDPLVAGIDPSPYSADRLAI